MMIKILCHTSRLFLYASDVSIYFTDCSIEIFLYVFHSEHYMIDIFSASDLAKEQKLNFGDDIASQLRLARKKRFSIQEEKRIAQEIELHSYLNKLIEKDKEEQISNIQNEEGDNSATRAKIQEIESKCVSIISTENNL